MLKLNNIKNKIYKVKDKNYTSEVLSKIFSIDKQYFYEILNKNTSISNFSKCGNHLDQKIVEQINNAKLDGIYLVDDSKRTYPYNKRYFPFYIGISSFNLIRCPRICFKTAIFISFLLSVLAFLSLR